MHQAIVEINSVYSTEKEMRTMAPGHPPSVKMTTSNKLASMVFGTSGVEVAPPSKSVGRYTLNMVNATEASQI